MGFVESMYALAVRWMQWLFGRLAEQYVFGFWYIIITSCNGDVIYT